MAHIHTNPGEHDPTVSAFIVRTDTDEPQLLLHMHKKLGMLLQPGGHVELTENPWQAICHEITEETGYELSQLKILQPQQRLKKLTGAILHPQPVVFITHDFGSSDQHKHTDVSYAFVTEADPLNMPADGESADFHWVTLQELKALDEARIFENVRQIGQHVLSEILGVWEPVELSEFDS